MDSVYLHSGDTDTSRTDSQETDSPTSTDTETTPDSNSPTDSGACSLSQCMECGGGLREQSGEKHCIDCGLVIDETNIDHGPEWRNFSEDPENNPTRVGSSLSVNVHDYGLSTNIGWSKTDSNGTPFSAKKRQKISRLRTWNKRSQTKSSRERGLRNGLGEISRMTSALGIPDDVQEIASTVYRRATNEDLIRGRSIEGIAGASLLAGLRMGGVPRSIDDVSNVSRVRRKRVCRAYSYIQEKLSLPVKTPTPLDYLPRIASDADICDQTMQKAEDITMQMEETGFHSGKDPKGVTAAAIYLVDTLTGAPDSLTQRELADVAQVSTVTVRNRKDDFRELIQKGEIESEYEANLMSAPVQSDMVRAEDAETTETITIRFREGAESQADAFARALRRLVEEYGLLDELTLPYRPSDKYLNAWLHSEPSQPFGESHGYWRTVTDECYVQAKMYGSKKQSRIEHFAAQVGVAVEFEGW